MANTRADYRAGVLEFRDLNQNVLSRMNRVFDDDFDTTTTIPASGARANGSAWVEHIVGLAPPTVAFVSNAVGGVVACSLTSASQAQVARCSWDDNRHFDVENNKNLLQCRFRLTTLPTDNALATIGLGNDHGNVYGDLDYHVGITIGVSGAVNLTADDGVTDLSTSSGFSVTLNQWHVLLIDMTNPANVRWFIDQSVINNGNTYSFAATGANAVLQPMFGAEKASGTGEGVLQVDNIQVWQD